MPPSATIHNLKFRRTRTGYSAMSFQVISAEGRNISVDAAEKLLPWEWYKTLPETFHFYPEQLHAITPQLDIMMRCVNLEKLMKLQHQVNSLQPESTSNKSGTKSRGGKNSLAGLFGNDDADPKIEMLYSPKAGKEKVSEKEALLRIPNMLANSGVINEKERLDFARRIEQGISS